MVIILPILLETHTVLNIWLIEVPDYLVQFTQLTLLLLLFDSFSGPLLTLLQASGNIRKYQIYVSILYTVTFFISWLLYFNGMNVYSSFGVKFIVSTLFSFFIRLYFTYKETNMDFCVYSFLKNVFVRSLVFFVCSLIIMLCFCHVLIDVDLTVKLFVIIVLNIFVSSFLFWIVVLDSDEKKSIINNIKQRKTRSSYDSK